MLTLKQKLAKNYINFRGWKTDRKIVVLESDDWGSLRMPSKKGYQNLLNKGYAVDRNKFTSLDGLESVDDLKNLFAILQKHKDRFNNHPVITACAVVANPDFNKIRDSKFKKYFFETIEETYKSYGEDNLLELWKDIGIKKNLLYPQFHGREHLNPKKWLTILNSDSKIEKDAFEEKALLGLSQAYQNANQNYMAAFEHVSKEHKKMIKKITIEGLKIFENLFGFKSISFMPSQSKQFVELNKTLIQNNVKFNQGGQYFSVNPDGTFKKNNKIWGYQDQYGMTYWRRNCTFEPYKNQNSEHIKPCLEEMAIAFKHGKPAVINSHRINYTSRIDSKHRNQSLDKLDSLLTEIIKKWPDVEFMNSEQMAGIIK